jgi:hypothetical protein
MNLCLLKKLNLVESVHTRSGNQIFFPIDNSQSIANPMIGLRVTFAKTVIDELKKALT